MTEGKNHGRQMQGKLATMPSCVRGHSIPSAVAHRGSLQLSY
jgi:hypothetical protein